MKILLLNGSPRPNGNTAAALDEMEAVFAAEGLETERVQVGNRVIRGCIACGKCAGLGRCVFDDLVNELAPKLEACDGLVVGSPVYYASANATLVALLTRLFYSTPFDKTMKVASSQYWNSIHGRLPGEAAQDAEGLQTMRTLARNMAFLVKSIALGREKYGLPEREEPLRTHFIR